MTGMIARPTWLDESVWPFSIRTADLKDRRVAFVDVGEGPTLFFLNVPQWSIVWRDVILLLKDDYRCIALDAPGVGLSDRIPAEDQHLGTVRDTVVTVIDLLNLTDSTLVAHDLGGLSALSAAAARPKAFQRLVAVNTFGWKPTGVVLPLMLRVFGSSPVRLFDTATRLLPIATSGPFGVGRKLDKPSRLAFRNAFDRPATAAMHRYFADAARNHEVHEQAAAGLELLSTAPNQTVFGAWGDYMRFGRRWRRILPNLKQSSVPRSLHFPMNDNPRLVADAIRSGDIA